MSSLLTFIKVPLYLIVGPIVVSTIILKSIVDIPTNLNTFLYKYRTKRLSPPYLDVSTYANLYNEPEYTYTYNQYKHYIHVLQDDKMLQANLLVNKETGKMVYVIVYDGQYKVVEEDIEKYKLN